MKHPAPSAVVSIPGSAHLIPLAGLPEAGTSYLRDGVPVGDLFLGSPVGGTAYGQESRPRLAEMPLGELDELIREAIILRERVAAWGTGAAA